MPGSGRSKRGHLGATWRLLTIGQGAGILIEMTAFQHLKLEKRGGVAELTICRPKVLNALDATTIAELDAAFSDLAEDGDIRAVLLTGEGDRAFVVGADIRELSALTPVSAKSMSVRGQGVLSRIENMPVPVIAAVNGYCLGGGCELAMACHLRIASETARFGLPEVGLGVIPGYGGTQRLTRLVGKGLALELLLSGDPVSAKRAERIGLVNRVVEAGQLMPETRRLTARICENAPLAVRYGIEAVNRGGEMPLSEALGLETVLFGLTFASWDREEGVQAFLEKRPPRFEGR